MLTTLCFSLFLLITPITLFCTARASTLVGTTEALLTLPATVADKWKMNKPVHVLKGKECETLPVGEIGLEYGLTSVTMANYTNGKDEYLVEIFNMRFPSGAYGFFTFLQSKAEESQRQFWAGHQLIQVRHARGSSIISTEFVEGLTKEFESRDSELPPLTKHLPKLNKTTEEEIYLVGPKVLASHPHFGFLKDSVNFEGGTEAITAEYKQAETSLGLLLLEFHTPQLANDGYTKLVAFKASLSEPALSQIVIKRVGNYVAVANPVKDAKTADSILGEIKYTAVVHWEGKTYSAIPLEYRPPDTAALEEASETALVLLRTFYWIGLMLALAAIFGVFAGSSFFYWRRYQRKKAGFDNLFSDAGGTIRLNLDDELKEEVIKRIHE